MKKLIAIVLILGICLSYVNITVTAKDVSVHENAAQSLKSLGLFKGVSENDFDLNREPTRVEALVMLIRILGKESEAMSSSYTHPFTDVPSWANSHVAYAYNKGITNGESSTTFGQGYASAAMYITFMLRALGYSDANSADFSWDNPYSLAESVGIFSSKVNWIKFLRSDAVLVSYMALGAKVKNSDTTLGQKLVSEGVFTSGKFKQNYNSDMCKSLKGEKRELSAEEIYALCSPAVFYIEVYDRSGDAKGSGSGFFIDSNGTAVTNYHVIEDMSSAVITHSVTEQQYEVEGVYDYDIKNDWAVIKVAGSDFDYLEFGSPSTIVGGANVYTIGSPMGLQNTISQGLISNTRRVIDDVTYIQTSAAISKGSSGGAFINKYGNVIGITSAGFVEGENLGLCIPVSVLSAYSTETLVTIDELMYGTPWQDNQEVNTSVYSVDDALSAFIKVYANDTVGDSLAYKESSKTDNGYVETYICLDSDGTLSTIVWSVTDDSTCFFSVDLNKNDTVKYTYYSYESGYDYEFVGEKGIYPSTVTGDYYLIFDNVSTYSDVYEHQKLASGCLNLALLRTNIVLALVSELLPGNYYSVADFGFTSFY